MVLFDFVIIYEGEKATNAKVRDAHFVSNIRVILGCWGAMAENRKQLCQWYANDVSYATNLLIDSEATFELKEHVDGIASFHVIVCDVLLVGQRLSCVDQTYHWNVNSLFLLKCLLDLENGVCGLEVKRLLNSSKRLYKENVRSFGQ